MERERQPMKDFQKFLEWTGLASFTPEKYKLVVILVTINCYIGTLITFTMSVGIAFTTTDFFKDGLESLQHGFSAFHVLTKQTNFLWRQKHFYEHGRRMDELWNEVSDTGEDTKKVMTKNLKAAVLSSRWVFVWYSSTFFAIVGPGFVFNIIGKCDKPPYNIWAPGLTEDNCWPYGAFLLFYLASCMAPLAVEYGYMIYWAFIAGGVINGISFRLRTEKEWPREKIVQIFTHHRNILNLVTDMNDLMGAQWVIELVASSLQITFRAYNTFMLLKAGNVILLIVDIVTLVACVSTPFIVCASGEIITSGYENLHRSAYQQNWYEEDAKTQKDLLFLMKLTAEPLTLNYRKSAIFDMPTFTSVINATCSYLAMLQFFDLQANQVKE